jgi:hypothetical protein
LACALESFDEKNNSQIGLLVLQILSMLVVLVFSVQDSKDGLDRRRIRASSQRSRSRTGSQRSRANTPTQSDAIQSGKVSAIELSDSATPSGKDDEDDAKKLHVI